MKVTKTIWNAPFHSAKLESGSAPGQSGFPRQVTSARHHRTLTFTLDFKDAYGILRIERPDLTRRKRVPPLDPRRNRRWRLHYLDERLRASDGHPATVHSLEPPPKSNFCSPSPLSWTTSVGPCEDSRSVSVSIYSVTLSAVIHQLICIWIFAVNGWMGEGHDSAGHSLRTLQFTVLIALVLASKTQWQIITNGLAWPTTSALYLSTAAGQGTTKLYFKTSQVIGQHITICNITIASGALCSLISNTKGKTMK